MGFYALALSGSQYLAPIMCGFIADGQGWRWVFYWPSIFCGIALVFCFLFMEETNYNRRIIVSAAVMETSETTTSTPAADDIEKCPASSSHQNSPVSPQTSSTPGHSTKTFVQKLSLWQPSPGQNIFQRSIRSLKFLGWPVIFYCG